MIRRNFFAGVAGSIAGMLGIGRTQAAAGTQYEYRLVKVWADGTRTIADERYADITAAVAARETLRVTATRADLDIHVGGFIVERCVDVEIRCCPIGVTPAPEAYSLLAGSLDAERRIRAEKDRLNEAILDWTISDERRAQYYAALQALVWVTGPDRFRAPTSTIAANLCYWPVWDSKPVRASEFGQA